MANSAEVFNSIVEQFEELKTNANSYFGGTKSAGAKARKSTMKLQDLFKEFRATTISEAKAAKAQ